GAGTGATVGTFLGSRYAMKGGIGTASERIGEGIVVGALVAVNATGDVVDPQTGQIVAGAFDRQRRCFLNIAARIKEQPPSPPSAFGNTTIGVVATNAPLSKEEVNKVAQMAHNGYALAIRPAHTMRDGDTIFALSYPASATQPVEVSIIGSVAAEVMARAVVRAVSKATSLHGVPACTGR
ncbi:MAG: peptidase S58 family protein, partial [Nitrospinota bacterium]